MKMIEMRFDSEQDRDVAALAMIAIREKIPEPEIAAKPPTLMVWETERNEFEKQMQECGIQYHVDHETEIPESSLAST